MVETSPIRPTNDEARSLARSLINHARFAAIGVLDPVTGTPVVSRIALAIDPDGAPLSLVSSLSHHTHALRACRQCSLLIGEPGSKGDPLTHPRLTMQCNAGFVDRGSADHRTLRGHFLTQLPKSKLYIDFADFNFVRFEPSIAYLNGGFGKAFVLSPEDLAT